ncbi:YchE family NAAT transporter [Buchnera aphidicola (Ceratovacuna keduensis)]|uniref:YchE family NAAT transporter n=1 Tax=Buchnera aphidicola TaxID=9 RepID=UPI0031B82ABD
MYLKSLDIFLYISFFLNLFILINPIGMIPIFISITSDQSSKERKITNYKVNITVFFILLFSLFFGYKILNIFGISIHSFRIAGGILITSMAMSMINDKIYRKNKNFNKKNNLNKIKKDISIVPLAIPLIAGPGVISSIIIWSTKHNNILNLIFCSIIIAIFSYICWTLFNLSNFFIKIFGENGINIITKIMGILLMASGIEFLIHEIKFFLLK